MERNRAIAWALCVIVTLGLIMVCRGCMGTPDTSGMKKLSTATTTAEQTTGVRVFTGATTTAPIVYDLFGRPVVQTTEAVSVEVVEIAETTIAEESGEETDFFGNTYQTETTTAAEGGEEIVTSESSPNDFPEAETTTLSPLEQYEASLTDPASIGGFNHQKYDDEGKPVATLAPDFSIIIE